MFKHADRSARAFSTASARTASKLGSPSLASDAMYHLRSMLPLIALLGAVGAVYALLSGAVGFARALAG